jgi:hypothetical protein
MNSLASLLVSSLLVSNFVTVPAPSSQQGRIDRSIDAGQARAVRVKLPFAKVKVLTVGGDRVTVRADRKVSASASEGARRWAEESKLIVERRGDEILVEDVAPNGRFNFSKDDHPHMEIEVRVPASRDLRLQVSAGTAEVDGSFDDLEAKVDAGTLSLDSVRVARRLDARLQAGTINASLDSVPNGPSSLSVEAGTLNFDLPPRASATVSARVDMGKIDGRDDRSERRRGSMGQARTYEIGGGGPRIDLEAKVGRIQFRAEGQSVRTTSAKETGELFDEEQLQRDVRASVASALRAAHQAMEASLRATEGSRVRSRMSDRDAADVRREVQQAMKQAREEIRRAMEEMRRELEQMDRKPRSRSRD